MDSIIVKYSQSPGVEPVPNQLLTGEPVMNTYDGRLFMKKSNINGDSIVSFVNFYDLPTATVLSASFSSTASFVKNAQTASYVLQSISASYSTTSSFATTASFVTTLKQNVIITGSLNISGSTTQIGNNTLLGNTLLSGSLTISGSNPGAGININIYGDTSINGAIKFLPVVENIDTSITASYIYVSGSTNDLYFSQNGQGYSNTTRLRWLEGNLYTGLLSGGVMSSTPGSTSFTLTSGSGIIVTLNASTGSSDPFPTIKYVKWNTQTYPITYSGSAKITYVGIDNTGTVIQQTVPFGTNNISQWDQSIELGVVLHLSGSVSSGVYNAPQVSYGVAQRTDDFVRAFGPMKLSGHTLQASGSTLGLIKTSGTGYNNGANYIKDANHPSTVSDPAITVSKIYRYYVSGSTSIIDTGIANAGYTTIDPTLYNNNGVLTLVPGNGANKQWSIQRVFWILNSPTNAFLVYYGNASYATSLDAQNAIQTEVFTEAPNTAQNAILIGYIIVRKDCTSLTDGVTAFISQGGLFRSISGIGSSNTSVISAALSGLSDVAITSPAIGDLLVYGNGTQWNNGKALSGSYFLTGSLTAINGGFTGSLSGSATSAITASYVMLSQTASFVTTAQTASFILQAVSSSYSLSSSYALSSSQATNAITASFVTTAQTASFVLQSVSSSYGLSSSYALSSSFSSLSTTASFIATASNAISSSYSVTASFLLGQSATSSYALSASNAISSSFSSTASFVTPLKQNVQLTGSLFVTSSTVALSLVGSGSGVFSVDGTSGRLFSVDDSLSGSLFSVNTAAGLPVIEAFSDNTIRLGQYGQKALYVSGTRVGIGKESALNAILDVSGSIISTGSISATLGFIGSLSGSATNAITASYIVTAQTASFVLQAVSSSFAVTASYVLGTSPTASYSLSSSNAISASYAVTSSYADNFIVGNTLTAQRIVVQTITSSISYLTGSTRHGSLLTDTHQFTGSILVSGSISSPAITGSLLGTATTASYALQAVSSSYAVTASFVLGTSATSSYALSASNAVSASYALFATDSTKLPLAGGTLTGNVIYSGDTYSTYGPNSTWTSYLRVGGNGRTVSGTTSASVVTTNGNLHLDAGSDKGTYINYYAGTAGIVFGTGASGVAASVDTSGNIWKGATIGAGTQYVYNSGTWGINVTGNAATTSQTSFTSLTTSALTVNTGGTGTWGPVVINSTSLWGDGSTLYATIGAGGAAGIMIFNPHIVWNSGNSASALRMGRSGGVSTGAYYEIGTGASDNFFIAKNALGSGAQMNINSSGNTSFSGQLATNGGTGYHVSFRPATSVTFNVGQSTGNIGTAGPFVNATILGTSDATPVPLFFNASVYSWFVGYSEKMRLNSAGTLYIGDGIVQYYSSWSDRKLKENLKVITNPLDKISKLTGYTFEWTKDSPYRNTPEIVNRIQDAGLIAQDVELVLPEIVKTTKESLKTVNYDGIIALHTEGIKELIKQNQELLERVKQLEAKLL
jgi:Chaperone of endosialidase